MGQSFPFERIEGEPCLAFGWLAAERARQRLLTGSLPHRRARKYDPIGLVAKRFSDLSGGKD
jgi:hypothetical protein